MVLSRSCYKKWAIENQCKSADILAIVISENNKLDFIFDPRVLCLPSTLMKMWQADLAA